MTEQDAFLVAIIENPWDDAPRLMFADHLEEQGESERSAFIRVQIELAALEAIGFEHCRALVVDPTRDPGEPDGYENQRIALRRREWELWGALRFWDLVPRDWLLWFNMRLDGPDGPPRPLGIVRRGFIERFTCSAADWLAHGEAVLAAQPVVSVVIAQSGAGLFVPDGFDRKPGESAQQFLERVNRMEIPARFDIDFFGNLCHVPARSLLP